MERRIHSSGISSLMALAAAVTAACFVSGARAAQVAEVWNGGTAGFWEVVANWNPTNIPDNGGGNTYTAEITTSATVVMTASHTIDLLTLDASSILNIANGTTLTFATNGTIVDNGMINVNYTSGGNTTTITFDGNLLSGSGNLVLVNSSTTAQVTGSLTQDASHTISGWGNIAAVFTNNGTVNGNVNGGALTLLTNNMTNNALFEATNGGLLNIGGITVTQGASGQILANGINGSNHSTVQLTGGTTISGGTLNTSNGGFIINSSGTNTLDSLTNNAAFEIVNNTQTNVTGNLVDNGTITVNLSGGGNTTVLSFNGGTLSGTGAINLNSTSTNAQLTGSLTQASGHTIEGFGQVTATLTNQGLVNANSSSNTLEIRGTSVINTATMEATAGTLHFDNSVAVTNTGGLVTANGGNVLFDGNASITGGTLTSASLNNLESDNASFTGITLSSGSLLRIGNNTTTNFTGTITDNSSIVVNFQSGGNTTVAVFNGTALLTGTGKLTLNGVGANAELNTATSATLTQDTQHTIDGYGVINAALTNNGTVNADVNGQILVLQTNAMSNSSLMEATNSGSLNIGGITVTQTGVGQVKADGGTVNLTGNATISGGTLNSANGGVIFNSSGTNTLDSLTNNADFRIANGQETKVTGNLTDNGTITVNYLSQGNNTVLNFNGGTLSGSGAIILDSSTSNAQLTGSLSQSSGHTIEGFGQVTAALTNNGIVNANVSGQTLTLVTNNMTNNNLFEATALNAQANVGTLNISGITVTQGANGEILADGTNGSNHSSVNLTGNTTISGGTIATTNGGIIFNSSGTNTLASLTSNADFRIANGQQTDITGNLVDNGTFTVNLSSGGNNTVMNFNGGTVSGTGTIILNSSTSNAQLTGSLTQSSGHTIEGFGQITAILDNQGLVNANSAGNTLEILGTSATNTSTLEATAGTLLFDSSIAVTNTGGTILANGGNVVFNSSASVTGGTLTSVSPNYLESDNASFTGITLSTGSLLRIGNDTTTNFTGAITDNGSILVNFQAGGNSTSAVFNGTASLTGGGTLTLNSVGSNAELNTATLATLTQDTLHTIDGFGTINAALTNNGTVNADVSGQILLLQSNAMSNTSLMEATGGGILNIGGITITQTGVGQIKADGSTVNLIGNATISGGTLNSDNGGAIVNSAGGNTLDNLTNNADFRINNALQTNITGDLVDNGTITINYQQGGNNTVLHFNGGTVSGTGAIILNGTGTNAQVTGSLTQDSGHTIKGFGQITAALTNQGLVNASVSGQTLSVIGNSSNTGTYEASAGGTLSVTGDLAQDDAGTFGTVTAGTYEALTNSTITLASPALPISTIGTNAVVILSGSGSVITSGGVSIDSTLSTNNGELHILNRTFHAIPFTNNGLLQLGGGGSLPTGGGVFNAAVLINTGTIEATGTGNVLTVTAGISDPGSPTIQIDANSTLDIASGGINNETGNLVHNGTTLTIGNNSIFVTNSYTNASFGTGNTFDKHANVTAGTGQIIAASTGITPVNNVTVNTSSVAFGNVHVNSSNSMNYQINNGTGGAVGPAVLFALQTSVNGGNITDPSLSGAGVTASNVGPVAINNNSGPLVVNYNPTVDGPLTGQAVHIANNFDNITETTLPVTGTAYNLAAPGLVVQSTYNLGPVHVGTALTVNPTFSNTAPDDGYSENLLVNIASHDANGYTTPGSTNSFVAPNSSHGGFVSVGLDTSAAQLGRSGSVTFQYQSDGTGANGGVNDGLGITTLGTATVTITADVLNYAVANLEKKSGDGNLSLNNPTTYTLDFGTISPGEAVSAALAVLNNVAGPADTLSGSFSTNAPDFTLGGLGAFSGIVAGAEQDGLTVGIDTNTPGLYNEFITLTPSSDDSAGDSPLSAITLDLVANVQGQAVPEPASLMLLGLGSAGLLLRRRRRM